MDNVMRYGLPKQATYYIQCHDEIAQYIKSNNNQLSKEVGKVYDMIKSRNTHKLYTKAERYNLRVPTTIIPKIEPTYNGERIHIKLEEVL